MTQTVAARPARQSSAHPAAGQPGRAASPIPVGVRPSAARAAAAARLVGATAAAAAARALPLDPSREGERPRHLRVVPPNVRTAAQRRGRARALLVAAGGLLMAIAFGLVYLHVVLAQRQFALDRLTTKVQADRATYQQLRLQVAQLGSPQHIISTAEGQLGMRPPASVNYLTPATTVGGAVTPPPAAATSGTRAPVGDADWPKIKSQLAGSP
jgi:cell division protein FtsL